MPTHQEVRTASSLCIAVYTLNVYCTHRSCQTIYVVHVARVQRAPVLNVSTSYRCTRTTCVDTAVTRMRMARSAHRARSVRDWPLPPPAAASGQSHPEPLNQAVFVLKRLQPTIPASDSHARGRWFDPSRAHFKTPA